MTESFGLTGCHSLPHQAPEQSYVPRKMYNGGSYTSQVPDVQQAYLQDQRQWGECDLFNDGWPTHVSPAASFGSGFSNNAVIGNSFSDQPLQDMAPFQQEYNPFHPAYGQTLPDEKPYTTHPGSISMGDTVPNTPQTAPGQLTQSHQVSSKRNQKASKCAFRPSAYQIHGMPIPLPPRQMTMPSNVSHDGQQQSAFRQPGAGQMTLGYYGLSGSEHQVTQAPDWRYSGCV